MSNPKSTGLLPKAGASLFYGTTLMTLFAASAVPTPLYRLYQAEWSLTPGTVTLVFAIYVVALLAAVLVAGSLSDYLGRRFMIGSALGLQIAAMGAFLLTDGPGWLLAARVLQGLAVGTGTSALGAALVDIDARNGPLVNSIAPFIGMACGALSSGALVVYAPDPLHFVFGVFLAIHATQLILIRAVPETIARRPGVLSAMMPRVTVPRQARRMMFVITPINIAIWSVGGVTLSLIPSVVATATGLQSPLIGSAVVAALMASGAAAVFVLRNSGTSRTFLIATPLLVAGLCILLAGVHFGAVSLLGLGMVVGGCGFGASFMTCVRSLLPLAEPQERAELLSAYYVQSYLSLGLPAVGAGFLAGQIGIVGAIDIFMSIILLLVLTGVATRWLLDRDAGLAEAG